MIVRELRDIRELKLCEEIEQQVWQIDASEVTAVSHLSATIHAGGLVAGAFEGARLLGFSYAFPAYHPECAAAAGLHSHLLAVLPDFRGRGVGKRLKRFQRGWCLDRGLPWMTWTFDPLQAKNARLNLEHLGAISNTYFVDVYGHMGGTLNADLPTDRLLAFWDLRQPHIQTLVSDGVRPKIELGELPIILSILAGEEPSLLDLEQRASRLRAEIPQDLGAMLARQPDKALRWRLALRTALQHYFARGYTVTRFLDHSYLLENNI